MEGLGWDGVEWDKGRANEKGKTGDIREGGVMGEERMAG